MKVCYFGAYNEEYPRNQIIRRGLQLNNVQVVECNVPQRIRNWRKYPLLLRQYRHSCRDCDVIIVAEFGHSLVPLAWLLSRLTRKPIVCDAMTSLYDINVIDRRIVKEKSAKALFYYLMDKLALELADRIFVDTEQHRCYYMTKFSLKASKMHVVPLGVNDELFYPTDEVEKDKNDFLVQFHGTFMPGHGVQYIVLAAKRLEAYPDIRFELIGKGQTFNGVLQLAKQLRLNNLSFIGPLPYQDIPRRMASADLCLGIFGDTAKARRVVPLKVYEILGMRKPLVTGDSIAMRDVFHDGKHLILCKMADSESLAEAILRLKADKELRDKIAREGYELVKMRFTPRPIGEKVKKVIDDLCI